MSTTTNPSFRDSFRTYLAQLKDPVRWKGALLDLLAWFLFGCAITMAWNQFSPGHPIVVFTDSIKEGVYWLDTQTKHFTRNTFVTFKYVPKQEWLKGRYDDNWAHTKILLGVPGDTLYADETGKLTLCRPAEGAANRRCVEAGMPQAKDSRSRPLTAWIQPNHQYTLHDDEFWVYATHPRSLDSRYHGPIPREQMMGEASPLLTF